MQPKIVTVFCIFAVVTANLGLVAFAQTDLTTEDQGTGPTTQRTTGTRPPTTTPQGSTVDWGQCKEGSDQMEPPICPEDDDQQRPVYFPFPYDCTQYFQCSNGLARCFKCPPGTVWDQQGTVCNFESEVGCNIVTTGSPRTTTTEPPQPTDTTLWND